MRAIAVSRLRLTKPVQYRRGAAALRDNATTICLGSPDFRASVFDSPLRDQQSQAAVCRTTCKDSAGVTGRVEARMNCTQGHLKTLTKWSVHVAQSPIGFGTRDRQT